MRIKRLTGMAILCALIITGCSNEKTAISQENDVLTVTEETGQNTVTKDADNKESEELTSEYITEETDTTEEITEATDQILNEGEYTYDTLLEKLAFCIYDDTYFSTRYIFSIEKSTADGAFIAIYEPEDGVWKKTAECETDITGIQDIRAVALSDTEFTIFYRTDNGLYTLDTVDKGNSYIQSELAFEGSQWMNLADAEFINNKYILALLGGGTDYIDEPNLYMKDRDEAEWTRIEYNIGELRFLQSDVDIRYDDFHGAVAEFTYWDMLWNASTLTLPIDVSVDVEACRVESELMVDINEAEEITVLSSADGSVIMELPDKGKTRLTWNGVECKEYFDSDFIANSVYLSEPFDFDNDGEMEREFSGLVGVRANSVSYIMDMVEGEIKLIANPSYHAFRYSIDEGEDFILKVNTKGNIAPLILDYKEEGVEGYISGHIWNADGTVKATVGSPFASEWSGLSTYILGDKVVFSGEVYLSMFSGADSFITIRPYYEIKDGKYELLFIEY